MYMINDTRLEEQLDAAASGYTPDNNSIPADVWSAIADDNQQQYIDDDCYDHTAEPDDQQQTVSQPSTQTAAQQQATQPAQAQQTQPQQTQPTDRDSLINRAADGVIDTLDRLTLPDLLDRSGDVPEQIRGQILSAMVTAFELENQARPRNAKLKPPQALPGYIVARIIMRTGAIRLMQTGTSGHKIIAKQYHREADAWKWSGTYNVVDEDDNTEPGYDDLPASLPERDKAGHCDVCARVV